MSGHERQRADEFIAHLVEVFDVTADGCGGPLFALEYENAREALIDRQRAPELIAAAVYKLARLEVELAAMNGMSRDEMHRWIFGPTSGRRA